MLTFNMEIFYSISLFDHDISLGKGWTIIFLMGEGEGDGQIRNTRTYT